MRLGVNVPFFKIGAAPRRVGAERRIWPRHDNLS